MWKCLIYLTSIFVFLPYTCLCSLGCYFIFTTFPQIIPDSLTTLLQYLSHLRQEFPAYGQELPLWFRFIFLYCSLPAFWLKLLIFGLPAGGQSANARSAGFSGTDGQELEAAVHSSEPRGLLTPESLAEVMSSARQLLVEQATECLSVCAQTM